MAKKDQLIQFACIRVRREDTRIAGKNERIGKKGWFEVKGMDENQPFHSPMYQSEVHYPIVGNPLQVVSFTLLEWAAFKEGLLKADKERYLMQRCKNRHIFSLAQMLEQIDKTNCIPNGRAQWFKNTLKDLIPYLHVIKNGGEKEQVKETMLSNTYRSVPMLMQTRQGARQVQFQQAGKIASIMDTVEWFWHEIPNYGANKLNELIEVLDICTRKAKPVENEHIKSEVNYPRIVTIERVR